MYKLSIDGMFLKSTTVVLIGPGFRVLETSFKTRIGNLIKLHQRYTLCWRLQSKITCRCCKKWFVDRFYSICGPTQTVYDLVPFWKKIQFHLSILALLFKIVHIICLPPPHQNAFNFFFYLFDMLVLRTKLSV